MTGRGPGTFVAIVGPSGSGKDSVLRLAREALALDARDDFHFARRVITREVDDGAEVHEPATLDAFRTRAGDGDFALVWEAHGCFYAIPADVDREIEAGRVVVANLSRAALPELRQRYASVRVVEITAPLPVLAGRIARRGRESGAEAQARLARSGQFDAPSAAYDFTIDNSGALSRASNALVRFLQTCRQPQATIRPAPADRTGCSEAPEA